MHISSYLSSWTRMHGKDTSNFNRNKEIVNAQFCISMENEVIQGKLCRTNSTDTYASGEYEEEIPDLTENTNNAEQVWKMS